MMDLSLVRGNTNISFTFWHPFFIMAVETGNFRLDGGGMFGVVPKVLWEKKIPADNHNRIAMTMRCLFIHSFHTKRNYLIDTGIGNKFSAKTQRIFSIDVKTRSLIKSLSQIGIQSQDITDIILTHLHFDHCGGCTYYDKDGNLELTFPNAIHYVSKNHWETATHPNDREKASFLAENIEPLEQTEKKHEIYIGHVFEPGLSVLMVNGHTEGQLLPLITVDNKRLLFCADLFPTQHHIALPWIMGYDMNAAETIKEKKTILHQFANPTDFLFLEHDCNTEVMQIARTERFFQLKNKYKLSDI